MDHCFVHNVVALEAVLLTLAVAFLLSDLFYAHNLKPAVRQALTRVALAAWLRDDRAILTGPSLWPAGATPG